MTSSTVYGLQWDTIGSLGFQTELHAYYINGKYATRPIVYRRGAVWIDVIGDAAPAARWLDVENEDATPEMVHTWLTDRESHVGPGNGGIYCSRSNLAQVVANAEGLKFDLWLATLDGTIFPYEFNTLPDNVTPVAVQCFPSSYLKINADLSVVLDEGYWNSMKA